LICLLCLCVVLRAWVQVLWDTEARERLSPWEIRPDAIRAETTHAMTDVIASTSTRARDAGGARTTEEALRAAELALGVMHAREQRAWARVRDLVPRLLHAIDAIMEIDDAREYVAPVDLTNVCEVVCVVHVRTPVTVTCDTPSSTTIPSA
jgi:hypothetical protein